MMHGQKNIKLRIMTFSKIFIEYYLWWNFRNIAAKETDPQSKSHS